LPIWGRRKREAQEALSSAKEIIIKVKKKGIDTSLAEGWYKEAKKAIKIRQYTDALERIEKAKKSAKLAYAKGIEDRLKSRISMLEKRIGEMNTRNLDTKVLSISLKKARSSLKEGVKGYKKGLKVAKEGFDRAGEKLEKFEKLSGHMSFTAKLLRRMEDYSPNLSILKIQKERLLNIEKLKDNGKIENALKEAKNLFEDVNNIMQNFSFARDSINALEKVIKDGDVLEANIGSLSKMEDAKTLFLKGEFDSSIKIADANREEISNLLQKHKDAKHHVDMAKEKVSDVKNWGFSAFEAEKELNSAEEALKNHEFERAITLSKESKEKASNIRERHRHSLELIHSAKEEVENLKAKGVDTTDIEQIIREAENEFNKGDYGASEEITGRVFELTRNLD
jgi:hypothetical protein